ncbi:MAG: hypothetical protein U1F10_14155 [Burkholderiales bacterium]
MPMPLPFALAVQRLNRQGLTVAAIAAELDATEDDVREAHRVLYLPVNDSIEPSAERSAAEREAELDRLPKRMQDSIRRSLSAG